MQKVYSLIKKVYVFLRAIVKKLKLNISWFFFIHFSKRPIIYTKEDTIKRIVDGRLSISRFGDGEFRLMMKTGEIGFQKENDLLANKLIKAFTLHNRNLLVCTYDFWEKIPMKTKQGEWVKWAITKYHKKIKVFYDYSYHYGNSLISRFYHPYLYKYCDFDYLEKKYIPLLEKIWSSRNLLIVEGEETRLGCGNDLFNNSNTIRRIICPSKNAFDCYDRIYESICFHHNKDDLVLLALGPTATVLAAELTINENYQVIDIGHIDVVYCWFLDRSETRKTIKGKYVNEADKNVGEIDLPFDEKTYEDEIVQIIKP